MPKKLSRYAQKRRMGLVPMQYGPRRCVSPPIRDDEARFYQSEQRLRDMNRNAGLYIAPIVAAPILRSKVKS